MESFEKILTNSEVLESIFRYLDFKEHLKLIKICPQFKYAILHGVWRSECKNLHILETSRDTYLLQYNPVNNNERKRSLTSKELHIILHHSSKYIQQLKLEDIRCLENIISLKYHNLIELTLSSVVKDTHLQQVVENCINLQSLTLLKFANPEHQSIIRPNVFGEMKALNKLDIYDIRFRIWNYSDVQQLFCLAHLKTLFININIGDRNVNEGNNKNSIDRVYNIENLKIGVLPNLQSWNLIRFQNLTKLSVRLKAGPIDDNILTQINNGCPKLCKLSFTDFRLRFKEFPRMNNLIHLTFDLCQNITFKRFNEIFRKLKLKSLSLLDVRMKHEAGDISNYNYISNTLETLIIKQIFDLNIVTTFFNRQHKFENVSKIRLEIYVRHSKSIGLCFSHNFPNVQELILNTFHISSEDILYLKNLKVLQFDLFDNMSWSYLEILFKHPTLTHITIKPFDCRNFERHCKYFPECCEGLTTTLEYLSLPSIVYERGSKFWASFRHRNKLMKLEIFSDYTSKRRPVLTL